MGNSTGRLYRLTTFGESHGGGVGVIIDGCPAGHKLDLNKVQEWLDRRRPGQSHLSSPRNEADQVECLSGMARGITLGTPLMLFVRNKDQKSDHYSDLESVYRPSHADYTTEIKYGTKAPSGGGRASARETIARVAAGAVAEQNLSQLVPGLEVVAFVESVKGVKGEFEDIPSVTRKKVEETPLRSPATNAKDLEMEIIKAKKRGDSVGGTVYCQILGCPTGLGEPAFDKFEAELAKGAMSLPASKGFEIGSGFEGTQLYGSEHNDAFYNEDGKIRTKTNLSGGIQGGITNGERVYFRVAFKPVATIFRPQDSVTAKGEEVVMKPKQGRHDPCVLPRAVPIVEAMALNTLLDHYLIQCHRDATRGPDKV
jgi:chorismate synthase